MRGRKPDTPDQQADKGAPGKRMTQKEAAAARRKAASPVAVGNVRPPKWLKKSRRATEIWNDLAPKLQRLNLLGELDAGPLARYCRYVVEWIAADLAVQQEGTWFDAVDTNGNRTKKRHPAWQAVQDIEKMLRELEATFGMRPDARYKIMRDQAAARGLGGDFGGLFGDQTKADAEPDTDEPQTPKQPEEVIGLLAAFDSAPPGRMN